ncbi:MULTISPECIES: UvrD-helicase domain-containing protein [unclassified Streptomyces]|uniref:UvrD-helicase domain-containing protein n=1 Tax=Streptomyces sp. NBC_00060 TaxID=2975636 RepID=A0AAU2H5L0_9ACTN
MPSHSNLAVLAAAGSRKTQHIVDGVLSDPTQRVLVTTYTTENMNQLVERLSGGTGMLPTHVTVMTWFTFLLNQCARPYQSAVLDEVGVMRGLNFVSARNKFIRKTNVKRYYLDSNGDMFRDAVAGFAYEADYCSGGKVINRLAEIFDHIYVDEVQDLAGYDLDLLDLLLKSPVAVTIVGDPRQATFATNNGPKNKKYKGSGIADWLAERKDTCQVDHRAESYRCNQAICDFADALFPELPRTTSKNTDITGHDGVFTITPAEVEAYVEQYEPVVLRWDKRTNTQDLTAMNFGQSKGCTFDRVLIFPTQPMIKYYRNRDPEQAGDRFKLYVAVTRAKYSVTFVIP